MNTFNFFSNIFILPKHSCNLDEIQGVKNKFMTDNQSPLVNESDSSGYLNNSMSMSPEESSFWKFEAKSPVVEYVKKQNVPVRVELHNDEHKMKNFMENIQQLVEKRVIVMKDLKRLILLRDSLNKNKSIVQYTAVVQDVKKKEKEKDKISMQILKKYNEYK